MRLARLTLAAVAVTTAAVGLSPAGRSTALPAPARRAAVRATAATTATTATAGYALVDTAGIVSTFGGAAYLGDDYNGGQSAPVVAAASTPDRGGYFLAESDGVVCAFGDARLSGSMAGRPLDRPIVGMAVDPANGGYWLVASDGGIFAFGGAAFDGSMGGRPLVAPMVGMAADPATGGYWLVAADGGIFAFGGAAFVGSMGGRPVAAPISALLPTPSGAGYLEIGTDGGVFTFGDAGYAGSEANPLHPPLYPALLAEDPSPTVAALALAPGPQPATSGPVRVSVMGDSLAFGAAFGFAHLESAYGAWVENAAIPGCGIAVPGTTMGEMWAQPGVEFPPLGACGLWIQRDQASLAATHPDVAMLLAGYWECQRWEVGGTWVDLDDPSFADAVEAQLVGFVTMVRATGAVAVLVTAPYFGDGTPPSLVDGYNALVRQAATATGAQVLDLNALLDPGGAYQATVQGVVARSTDSVHLTFAGVEQLVTPALLPDLVAAGQSPRV